MIHASENWFLIDELHGNFGLQDDIPEVLTKIGKKRNSAAILVEKWPLFFIPLFGPGTVPYLE